MLRFIGWRLVQFPVVLTIIYLVTFLLAWVAPGSPFERSDRKLPPEVEQSLRQRFHAESAWSFLVYYPRNIVLHGDFGSSFSYEEWSVNDILASSLPISVTLGLAAITIAVLAGVGIGTLAAVRRDGLADYGSLMVALVGVSLPSFVTAALLAAVFSMKLQWLEFGGWGQPSDIILPSIALSLMPMAYIARLTRVSMIDVLSSDYVRTARAKGLSRQKVVWKHCLRNAFVPVLSYLGPATAMTMTGSFVVEKVFNIPGLGQHFVNSVLNRDQTLILGTVMVYSTLLLVFNLLVDIGYGLIDPRIELSRVRGAV